MTDTSRSNFALSGPSIALDARTQAVRGDLADIALAGKLFVPHYAVPMEMRCINGATMVRIRADADSECAATLNTSESFMVVDMSGSWAWGFTAAEHVVGYVPLEALEQTA